VVVLLIWDSVRMPRPSESRLLGPAVEVPTSVQINPAGTQALSQPGNQSGSGTPETSQAAGDVQVVISSVIGAGDLIAERVIVERIGGEGELSLANWSLKSDNGPVYTFPKLVLYKGGAVNVHTSTGVDTVVDLYWGLNQAAWQTGSKVKLLDPQGKEQSVYQVP